MKKSLFLMLFTLVITVVLFISGVRLLAMVDEIDVNDPFNILAMDDDDNYSDEFDENDSELNNSGNSNRNPVKNIGGQGANGFLSALRSFKTDKSEPINVLVMASDDGDANTDAIMVMHFDPNTSQVNIISIPRDTYIEVKGLKSHKINSIYRAKDGATRLKTALESMLGQPIDYYLHLNLKTMREIVDLLGGVEYNVPCELKYSDPVQNLKINISKGLQVLDGKQVEGLLRFRHPNGKYSQWPAEVKKYYDGSDLKRIERQHDFFNEFLKQKISIQSIPKINSIINTVYENITTDLPVSEMLKLVRGIAGFSSEKFQTAMIPGTAKYIGDVSYYVHDEKQTPALAEVFLSDKPPVPTPVSEDAAR